MVFHPMNNNQKEDKEKTGSMKKVVERKTSQNHMTCYPHILRGEGWYVPPSPDFQILITSEL